MLLKGASHCPSVDPSAVIAPNATLVGDVRIGARCVIGYGVCRIPEGQPITLGEQVIVRDNAVIRSTAKHLVEVGNAVLIGPHTALFGCNLAGGFALRRRCLSDYSRCSWQRPLTIEGG